MADAEQIYLYLEATQVGVELGWEKGRFPFMWNKIDVFNRNNRRSERAELWSQFAHATQFRIWTNKSHSLVLHSPYIMSSTLLMVLLLLLAWRRDIECIESCLGNTKWKDTAVEHSSSGRVHHKTENVFGWIGYVFKWRFFCFCYLFQILLHRFFVFVSVSAKKIENICSLSPSLPPQNIRD